MITINARQVFFPLAAIIACIGPWLLVLTLSGHSLLRFSIPDHAHSMLYGYVGALIVGYLLGKPTRLQMYLLILLWLSGRLLEIFTEQILLTHIAYASFGLVIAIMIAPKFLVAKKLSNLLMVPILALIGVFPLFEFVLSDTLTIMLKHDALILLISTLLCFMGGRFITPLLTKAFAKTKRPMAHRVQPRIELSAMLILLTTSVLAAFDIATTLKAYLCIAAAVLIVIRIVRWEFYKVESQQSYIWTLMIGYFMLALGLAAYAESLLTQQNNTASLHLITIGSLGVLSTTVMLKSTYTKQALYFPVYYLVSGLIVVSSITRYISTISIDAGMDLLVTSTICWSLGFIVVTIYLIKQSQFYQYPKGS